MIKSISLLMDYWKKPLRIIINSARKQAMSKLNSLLTNNYYENSSSDLSSELISLLKKSLKQVGGEGILAAKALSLIWITEGGSLDEFNDVCKLLLQCIKGGDPDYKLQLIQTLGMIAFIEDLDKVGNNQLLFQFEDYFTNFKEPELIEQSLNQYGLLYSKNTTEFDQEMYNIILNKHFELLSSTDLNVRISAGENMALIIEQHRLEVENGNIRNEFVYEKQNELEQLLQELSQGFMD